MEWRKIRRSEGESKRTEGGSKGRVNRNKKKRELKLKGMRRRK